MKNLASAIGLILVSLVFSVLVGEFVLFPIFLNRADFLEALTEDDPILGVRIAPYSTGHDALGFRNPRVPDSADIVAVGDSQTYGVSTTREGSWPYQLGVMLDEPVYNMGLGNYGPMEYLYLVRNNAPKLHPKLIIVGFYFGNDLFDACWAVEQRPYWSEWRRDGSMICRPPPQPGKHFAEFRDWLARHSVLYNIVKDTIFSRLITWIKDEGVKQGSPDVRMVWRDPVDPSVQTIFTPQGRNAVIDPNLASVQKGLRITEQAFGKIREAVAKQGARLLVLMIPTKETVYCPYLEQSKAALPQTFVQLCRNEETIRRQLVDYFSSADIAYVDAAPAMQEAASHHATLYRPDWDGHPVAAGYRVIAQTVAAWLKAHAAVLPKPAG